MSSSLHFRPSPEPMNDPVLVDEPSYFPSADSDHLIFGPIDLDDNVFAPPHPPSSSSPYDSWHTTHQSDMDLDGDVKPYDFSGPSSVSTSFGFSNSYPSSFGSYASFNAPIEETKPSISVDPSFYSLSSWINDQDTSPTSPTSPIPIPSTASPVSGTSFVPFMSQSAFPHDTTALSPTFAAMQPLPASVSPSVSSFDGPQPFPRQRVDSAESVAPQDTVPAPTWASQLWENHSPNGSGSTSSSLRSPSSPRHTVRHSPLVDSSHRSRVPGRYEAAPTALLLASTSAPATQAISKPQTRSYSRRAESVSIGDDHDATIRRKRLSGPDRSSPDSKGADSPPLKSQLRVPKLAPSAWQLYFTDWIQKQQATSTRKLNVAQAAKEAGLEYANLTEEEKEPYKRKSQAAKEAREREHNAYMRSLTPEDIKKENAFRAAQRKAGKSRKSNLKDPNAPKKPLSAYFMFLQRIRSDPLLVQDIFGDETETTKQSVLAAAKWRSMTDDERKPFLAQAEQEKMEYEAARRIYEDWNAQLRPEHQLFHSPADLYLSICQDGVGE
ncbi:hypothetical protein DL96DRAFT_1553835 [Flagelloscypha sp. PMI_526]|nr:hypothetical protein DL96DRAFT_1553835 [Flagelloscypha sp. PMI_526]